MITVADLKAKVAAYLQRPVSDYVVNGVDLCLDAINKSHQFALMQYDFEFAKCSVDVSVSLQTGAALSPLALHGTSDLVTVKKVLRAWVGDGSGGVRPIKFTTRSGQASDSYERWAGVRMSFAPSRKDYPAFPYFAEPWLVQIGNQLMLYPSSVSVFNNDPVPLFLDVIRYFPDYIDSDDNSDFILQYCDDWLAWASICRLNVFSKEFVPRQEGNVAPPTDERDRAWQDLLAWDAQLVTTGDSFVGTLD